MRKRERERGREKVITDEPRNEQINERHKERTSQVVLIRFRRRHT